MARALRAEYAGAVYHVMAHWYLKRTGQKPVWLETGRVLAAFGSGEEGIRGYRAYLEGRVLELGMKAKRLELEAQWQALRRGWD